MDSDTAYTSPHNTSTETLDPNKDDAQSGTGDDDSPFPTVKPFYTDAAGTVDSYRKLVNDHEVHIPDGANLFQLDGRDEWMFEVNDACKGRQVMDENRSDTLGPEGRIFEPGDDVYLTYSLKGWEFLSGSVTDEQPQIIAGRYFMRVHFVGNPRGQDVELLALRATWIPIERLRYCYQVPRSVKEDLKLDTIMNNGWTFEDLLKLKVQESVVCSEETYYVFMSLNDQDYALHGDELDRHGNRVAPPGHSSLLWLEDLDRITTHNQRMCLKMEAVVKKAWTTKINEDQREAKQAAEEERKKIREQVHAISPGLQKLLQREQENINTSPLTAESMKRAYLREAQGSKHRSSTMLDFEAEQLVPPKKDSTPQSAEKHQERMTTRRGSSKKTADQPTKTNLLRSIPEEKKNEDEDPEPEPEPLVPHASSHGGSENGEGEAQLNARIEQLKKALRPKYGKKVNMKELCREILDLEERNVTLQKLLDDRNDVEGQLREALDAARNRADASASREKKAVSSLKQWEKEASELQQRDRVHDDKIVDKITTVLGNYHANALGHDRASWENSRNISEMGIYIQHLISQLQAISTEIQKVIGIHVRVERDPSAPLQFIQTPETSAFLGSEGPPTERFEDPSKYKFVTHIQRDPSAPSLQPGGFTPEQTAQLQQILLKLQGKRRAPSPEQEPEPKKARGEPLMDFSETNNDDDLIVEEVIPAKKPTALQQTLLDKIMVSRGLKASHSKPVFVPKKKEDPKKDDPKKEDPKKEDPKKKEHTHKKESAKESPEHMTAQAKAVVEGFRNKFRKSTKPMQLFMSQPAKYYFHYPLDVEDISEVVVAVNILKGSLKRPRNQLINRALQTKPTPPPGSDWNSINWMEEPWFRGDFVTAKLLYASQACSKAITEEDTLEAFFWTTWCDPHFDWQGKFSNSKQAMRFLNSAVEILKTSRSGACNQTPSSISDRLKLGHSAQGGGSKAEASKILAKIAHKESPASSRASTPGPVVPRPKVPGKPKLQAVAEPKPVPAKKGARAMRRSMTGPDKISESNISEYDQYKNMYEGLNTEIQKTLTKIVAEQNPANRASKIKSYLSKFLSKVVEDKLTETKPVGLLTFPDVTGAIRGTRNIVTQNILDPEKAVVQMRRFAWVCRLMELYREAMAKAGETMTNEVYVNLVLAIMNLTGENVYAWELNSEIREMCKMAGTNQRVLKKATEAREIFARMYGIELEEDQDTFPRLAEMKEKIEDEGLTKQMEAPEAFRLIRNPGDELAEHLEAGIAAKDEGETDSEPEEEVLEKRALSTAESKAKAAQMLGVTEEEMALLLESGDLDGDAGEFDEDEEEATTSAPKEPSPKRKFKSMF